MIFPLFEDNHLFVLNKPPGLLTQPSGTEQDSLEVQAKEWLKIAHQKPGNVFLEAVHRLDRPVSGIVVFAKTSKALSRLNAFMREKQTRKIYWACVEGEVNSEGGVLENYLRHDNFHAEVVTEKDPKGKLARLTYKVLERSKHSSLLEIELETGRYHQIRLQLSAYGHPILGDTKYGGKRAMSEGVIALHHRKMEILHPVSKEVLAFEAPLPDSFPK